MIHISTVISHVILFGVFETCMKQLLVASTVMALILTNRDLFNFLQSGILSIRLSD